jgi:hypothetical protein
MQAAAAQPSLKLLSISSWPASVLLLKAFRRGSFEFAAKAASTLLAAEPAQLEGF